MSIMPQSSDLRELVPAPWMIWVKLGVALLALALAAFVVWKLFFADIQRRVATERGGRIVAEEQVEAEANVADKAIERVHERDVYRERVKEIVTTSQEEVNHAWHGETVGADVDAAGAAALCRLRVDLCRGSGAAQVQPVREPVPGANGTRQAPGE